MTEDKVIRAIKLADKHGTPLYVYDAEAILKAVNKVKTSIAGFNLIYSVKANPFISILRLMSDNGVGIDAGSKNEALDSIKAGHYPENIYFSAPGKSRKCILGAWGKCKIIADSLNELSLINETAKEKGETARVGVRINLPSSEMRKSRFEVMGGTASKFGIESEVFFAEAEKLAQMKNIRINGLHVYFGSQLADEKLIANNFNVISRCALQIKKIFPLEYVNYGGGFGVPYRGDEQGRPELNLLALYLKNDAETKSVLNAGIRANIELGRYLTAQAGYFISSVADVKRSGGKTFVILDGGMNSFFRPKFTGQKHQVWQHPIKPYAEKVPVVLTGNTCTPLDVFYEDETLSDPSPGDKIIFGNAGAYGYSMSLLEFISFDKPKQIML
ncbi:MAG: hypothetical protein FWE82_02910 [Defluviitaleaceae bacterium]|nr:hypothetical protein [Defluviitaleaceae bacterium]